VNGDEAVARARTLFLDDSHPYGCAETAFMVLKEAFGLPAPTDPSAAMTLNGGVAHSGGICGAISGSALAVGLLAGRRIEDHALAKRTASEIVSRLLDDFAQKYGAVDCHALLGREIRTPEQHQAFLDSGVWRRSCMAQVAHVVHSLAELPDDPIWDHATAAGHPRPR
jgi:C_GCAxxG_C_C family probable redox protein